MSRIPFTTTDQQPEPIRQFMARRGDLNLFRLLANAPAVFIGWAQMVDEMLDSPTFTARMRELIILRVAHLQGSPYELSQHLGLARSARRRAATARSGRSGHQEQATSYGANCRFAHTNLGLSLRSWSLFPAASFTPTAARAATN